jgi:hypothetical protein
MTRKGATRGLLAAAVLWVMAMATTASAEMFYREVAKDNRIYVFSIGKRYDTFEKSGGAEIGVAITRLGYGPNGETVIFDSEDAINLYNFKHNLPGEYFAKPEEKPKPPGPSGKVTGLAFGDFYYFSDHHDPKFDGQQGFWLRRAYLGYDQTFSPTVNARLRLEMNSNGALAGGNLVPFVKDAWVTWKYYGNQQARLGIEPSLTMDSEEAFWGLRHIEKTPADLYAIDASRDFGLAFTGPITDGGLSYGFQFGNDAAQGGETDKFKVVRFQGLYEPKSGLRVEGNFNYGERPNGQDRTTAKGFLGFRGKSFRAGGEYLWQERKSGNATPDTKIAIYSAFAVWDAKPKSISLFGRWDSVNPERGSLNVGLPGADVTAFLPLNNQVPFNFFVAGLEIYIAGGFVRLSPNVEWVTYDDLPTGVAVGKDVIPRLTFYWTW